MKKFLFLLVFPLFMLAANAQVYTMTSQYAKLVDTVGNNTKYLKAGPLSDFKTIVTVQLIATEISGTTGGTATLQASLDGVNFYQLADTVYTLTDVATQTFAWHVTGVGDSYLRVKVAGTGTMSDKIVAKYLTR